MFKFYINKSYLRSIFRCDIRNNLGYICSVLGAFCIGIIFGITVAVNLPIDFFKFNLFEELLLDIYSPFGKFCITLILFALLIYAQIIVSFNRCFAILSYATLIFLGYRLVINCQGAINVSISRGILTLIFFHLPIYCSMCIFIGITMFRFRIYWLNCRTFSFCKCQIIKCFKLCNILIFALSIILLFVCILIPCMISLIFY